MTGDRALEPLWVVEGAGKIRNGLYMRAIAMYEDRIVFEVFASRPLDTTDLEELVLTDDVGTDYELVLPKSGVLEGKAGLQFRPAFPDQASTFSFGQPGWWVHGWGMNRD